MEAKTILLVEDEALIALMETRQLEEAGYRVIHVSTGEAALALVQDGSEAVDLILMDIDLGRGMDGTTAAREILSRREIPLLFLSGHQEKELVDKTEQITNYGYVVKNSAFTVLYASIRMAFKLFEAQRKINQKSMEIEATNEELRVTIETLEETNRELFALEDKFSKAFHLNPDSIIINRLSDGRFMDINEGFTQNMGYAWEDVMGRSTLPEDLGIWANPEDRRRLLEGLQARGEVANLEAPFRRKDGSLVDGMMSARIIDVNGERCVISITRDISARKEKELALAASEARYRSLLLSIGEGFCHQDENEVFQFANPAAERIFGVGPGTLIGHRVQDFLDAEGLAIQQAQNERRRQDESSSFLTPIIRDDGVRRVLRVRASPVQDGSGRFQGSSVVFTDVTEEPSA